MNAARNLMLCLFVAFALQSCGGGNGGGCSGNESCAENQFCKFDDGACGGSGTCVDKPASCPATTANVCSCDKLSFFNSCWSDAAGQSVASQGECP